MGVGLDSYIEVAAGMALILIGSIIKYITKSKVDDIDGHIGRYDGVEIEDGVNE